MSRAHSEESDDIFTKTVLHITVVVQRNVLPEFTTEIWSKAGSEQSTIYPLFDN